MKKTLFFLLFCCITICLTAQNRTRGNVMTLFYKAQKAEKAGNAEEAVNYYKAILSIDETLPVPYLKMAGIYARDNNPVSATLAVECYQKYLTLKPDAENAASLRDEIKKRQAVIDENQQNGTWPAVDVDLAETIQSDPEKLKEIILSVVHPALKANTKEEIVEAVEDISELYDKAQKASATNNTEKETAYLNQIIDHADPSDPVYAQVSMLLAEAYESQGDIQKMKEALTALENNIRENEKLKQYYGSILKDAIPFEDDICGIWVSDLAYDENSTPYVAIEISKGEEGHYDAKILPYCTLAEENNMYKGKEYKYTPTKIKSEDKEQYFPFSYNDISVPDKNQISFNFGDEKLRKGLNEGIATALNEGISDFGQSVINENSDPWMIVITEVVTAAIQGIILLATISQKTNVIYDANIQKIIPDCANLELVQIQVKETSTGYKKETSDTTQMRIYKLNPDDKIYFISKNGELFGHKQFDMSDAMQMDEYAEIVALKDKGYFNRKSFKKLSEKIINYCWSKAEQDPDMKILAYESMNNFKHSTQGLCHKKFTTDDGEFIGWIDKKGKMNGTGIWKLVKGYHYVGEFKNNKYSGLGTLTLPNGSVYSGNFEQNKRNGRGIYTFGENTYEGEFKNDKIEGKGKLTDYEGNIFEGYWKNGQLKEGTILFKNGSHYKGSIKLIKKDDKRILVPNGKGTMVLQTGEVFSGKWKNGELVNKDNKQ